MDLFFAAYCAALFALPILLYKLTLPNHHGPEKRTKDWYYALKRILCYQKLRKFMTRPVNLPPNQPESPSEDEEEDLLTFHAVDVEKNSLYVRFAVASRNELLFAEILLQLRLADGRTFTLPEGVLLCSLRAREWRTKVLTITRQLDGNYRLIFNGFLKEITHDFGGTEHLTFNCLFSRASDALIYPKFFDKGLFGDAVCRVQWRDGNWTDKLGDQIGESNFGELHGTVKSGHFGLDTILSMGAYQNRRFGTADRYECARSVEMLTVGEDGTLIFAENKRTAYTPSAQVRHGAVLLPNGDCININGCDLPLPDERGNTTTMTVHVSTTRKQIKAFLTVNDKSEVRHCSRYGFNVVSKLAETSTPTGRAVTSLLFSKRVKSSENEHKMELLPPLLVGNNMIASKKQLTLSLERPEAENIAMTGGKGQSLAILTSIQQELGFSVPLGFVITTTAMDLHMFTDTSIRAAMTKLKMAAGSSTIEVSCKNLQEAIIKTKLSEELKDCIITSLNALNSNKNLSFAVRSSGVSEDSETTSAAGQNETFLGCRTEENVLEAVKKCWASLYSFRSVEYRRQHGMDVETSMGVVVQVMTDSRIAGVLFTCDLDGNPGRMRITSNYGLGESIVSGEEGGDVIHVRRTWNNNISIETEEVSTKKTKITLCQDKGTGMIYLSDASAKEMSICREEVLTLAKVATQLEDKYGKHLDIEWAFDHHDKVVLLQARPVTFLENWTDYELEHEFDVPVLCQKNVYTTANVKEVIPGAITPLSNSTVVRQVDESVGMCVRANVHQTLTRRKYLVTMHHHIFMDFYNVLMILPSDSVDLTTKSIDISVCGHAVTTPEMLRRAIAINGRCTLYKKGCSILDMLKSCMKVGKLVEETKELAGEPFPSGGASLEDLLARIDRHLVTFTRIINTHSIASRASSFYQMLSMNILSSEGSSAGDGSELTPEKFAQIALLFSNGSGVISAEIPADLEDIATEIRKSPLRDDFVTSAQSAREVLAKIPEAEAKFVKFLKDHGHRSSREFEVMETSWGNNLTLPIKMLQTLAKLNNGTKKALPLTVDEVVDKLGSNMNRRFLKFLVGKCRSGVVNREKSKSEVVRHINTLRGAFIHLGERLCQRQIIPQAELVYFLTYQEIKHLVKGADPVPIAKAMRRKRLYETWNSYKFPEMSFGMPQPLPHQPQVDINPETELTGTPVCAGKVTARCCCIDNLRDIDQLQQNDVLITHGTDVAWTPYFPMLSGVVTELGGLISHGAVVAREYGVPCLVGVAGALNTFRTGDQVILDATRGKLYKLP